MHIKKQDKITHLGANSDYPDQYAPELPAPCRARSGSDGVDKNNLPFSDFDLLTAFELSWLNAKGKPVVGIGEFTLPHITSSTSSASNAFSTTSSKAAGRKSSASSHATPAAAAWTSTRSAATSKRRPPSAA